MGETITKTLGVVVVTWLLTRALRRLIGVGLLAAIAAAAIGLGGHHHANVDDVRTRRALRTTRRRPRPQAAKRHELEQHADRKPARAARRVRPCALAPAAHTSDDVAKRVQAPMMPVSSRARPVTEPVTEPVTFGDGPAPGRPCKYTTNSPAACLTTRPPRLRRCFGWSSRHWGCLSISRGDRVPATTPSATSSQKVDQQSGWTVRLACQAVTKANGGLRHGWGARAYRRSLIASRGQRSRTQRGVR